MPQQLIPTQSQSKSPAAAMVPFFPDYAEKHLRANSTVIGVIFALYPLSLFLTSLVAGMASARFGRVLVYIVGALCVKMEADSTQIDLTPTTPAIHPPGLVLLGGGTVGFGFCDSLASIMAMRVVQGIGGGCINVAGMALLLQVRNSLFYFRWTIYMDLTCPSTYNYRCRTTLSGTWGSTRRPSGSATS
jgi:MFS family permease